MWVQQIPETPLQINSMRHFCIWVQLSMAYRNGKGLKDFLELSAPLNRDMGSTHFGGRASVLQTALQGIQHKNDLWT
jgi:hypothetical protein